MADSVPVAGASGHRSLAPISSPATKPPCPLLLHSLQNQAAASQCSSSNGEGKRGKRGEGRRSWRSGRRGRRRRGGGGELAARWHPKEEHVCSWLAAWGQRPIPCMRVLTHTHT